MNKPAGSPSNPPVIEREEKDDVLILHLKGDWVIANGSALATVLQQAGATHSFHLHIDGAELGRLDTIGALMVNRLIWQHHEEVALGGFDEDRMIL
ncbi:MAG: hypothetical protein R3360_00255, partial [Alphaproteobacteria bacterium]|nr:hypothetical protein [Alphaproteobacteria bacterium]